MDPINATQVLDDQETINRNDHRENKQVGILRVGTTEHQIINGLNRIGRSPVCNIVLKDPTVSLIHAEIQAGPEAAYVTDLRSANGTTLKSLPLKAFYFYPINDGDVILFSRVKATFVVTKELTERSINVTPKTSTGVKGAHRVVARSSLNLEDDLTIDDPDESVVPGSQRKDNKQRLFRLPTMPADRRKTRGRFSDIVETSSNAEDRNDTGNSTVSSVNVCAGKTSPVVAEKAKNVKRHEDSLKNTDVCEDIHEMETQDILDGGPFLADRSKKPRIERSPDVFAGRADDNIYEAETQPLSVAQKPSSILPSSSTVVPDREDSNDDEENVIRRKSPRKECRVIEETDDESGTDDEITDAGRPGNTDDLSDGSVTDDENKFANLSPETLRKKRQTMVSTSLKVPSVKEVEKRATPETSVSKSAPKRPVASANIVVNDEVDLDLLPTQVLDVATSTPMTVRQWASARDDSDESISVVDDQDIHNILTQVATEKDKGVGRLINSEKSTEKREKSQNEKVNLNDTLDKNMGNIFGHEGTNGSDAVDEPTQLMTQNLVDILNPTQIVTREKTDSPSRTVDGIPIEKGTNSNDTSTTRGRKRKKSENVGTLGFVDGRAVNSYGEFSRTPTTTSTDEDEIRNEGTETTANGHLTTTPCDEDDDILCGLPEVKICGTLSYPGSPASSDASSENDLVVPSCGKSEPVREADADGAVDSAIRATRSNVGEARDSDFSSFKEKSRIGRKPVARNHIADDDEDTDDDLDYNELRTMADKLLASASANVTKVRRGTRARSCRSTENVDAKKVGQLDQKLSKVSSSIAVTDTDESVSSTADTSSKRPRQSTRNNKKGKKNVKKEIAEEPSSVDGTNQMPAPTLTGKPYAKVQLTRLDDSEVRTNRENVQSNLDTSNGTRKRRSTWKVLDSLESSPTTETRVKNRRTMDAATAPVERHKILFTGVKDDDYEKMVAKLGGSVVSDPSKATILITDKIRRTFKFLCAVAQGLKVVSIKWLIDSNDTGHFLDCDGFILRDAAAEAKFKFKLAKSLNAARTKKLLDGYTVIITPKVNQPEIHELKGMVEACGGKLLVRAPRSWDDKTVIISREDDLAAAKSLVAKSPKGLKITIQSTEFLLTGILRQEVNLVDHRLQ